MGASVLVVSAAAAGSAAGATVGFVGASVPDEIRGSAGWLLMLSLCLVVLADGLGLDVPLPQRDKETPRRWADEPMASWAVKAGVALGLAVTNRLGFVIWYAIPVLVFSMGSVALGALSWATYAFARTTVTMVEGRVRARRGQFGPVTTARLVRMRFIRQVSSAAGSGILLVPVVVLA